jgi:hypothetical protein
VEERRVGDAVARLGSLGGDDTSSGGRWLNWAEWTGWLENEMHNKQ